MVRAIRFTPCFRGRVQVTDKWNLPVIMKPVSRLSFTVPVIIAVVAALWLLTDSSQQQPRPTPVTEHTPEATGLSAEGQQSPSKWVGDASAINIPDRQPPSLMGTSEPGGWAKTDRLGNLIPTGELRQLFEYYLSALGEEDLPQLVARIRLALSALKEPAKGQAMNTLGQYLDYKLALSDLEAAYGNADTFRPNEVRRRMAEIRALRRTWMDADTAEAFFANEEAIDRYQLEARRIGADESLSGQQREEALAEAEMALPEPVRQARQETRKFARYEQAREALADDPEALRAMRQQEFGKEAAQRLESLEAEQKDWNRRWRAYAKERDALKAAGLAEPERKDNLARLREKYFTDSERVRARALDSVR